MRRHSLALGLILLLLLAAGGFIWLSGAWQSGPSMASARPMPKTIEAAAKPEKAPDAEAPKATTVNAVPRPVVTEEMLDPGRFRRAYMLMLDKGKLSLEETNDLQGYFSLPRRKEEEWTGMLRCRLLDSAGKVLAEDVMSAPDQLCVVLDGRGSEPKPVQLSVPGPVLFQVRLPHVRDAAQLDITRITGAGSFRRDQPVGTIALTGP